MERQLAGLLAFPGRPPFVHVHHPHHPPSLVDFPASSSIARLDAIEHHTPRLVFSGILHKLGHETDEVATWDLFARGMREVYSNTTKGKGKDKGKQRQRPDTDGDVEMNGHGAAALHRAEYVVIVTHGERLRHVLGPSWSVLTRMAELVCSSRHDDLEVLGS